MRTDEAGSLSAPARSPALRFSPPLGAKRTLAVTRAPCTCKRDAGTSARGDNARANTFSGVDDRELDTRVGPPQQNLDSAPSGSELDGVGATFSFTQSSATSVMRSVDTFLGSCASAAPNLPDGSVRQGGTSLDLDVVKSHHA